MVMSGPAASKGLWWYCAAFCVERALCVDPGHGGNTLTPPLPHTHTHAHTCTPHTHTHAHIGLLNISFLYDPSPGPHSSSLYPTVCCSLSMLIPSLSLYFYSFSLSFFTSLSFTFSLFCLSIFIALRLFVLPFLLLVSWVHWVQCFQSKDSASVSS